METRFKLILSQSVRCSSYSQLIQSIFKLRIIQGIYSSHSKYPLRQIQRFAVQMQYLDRDHSAFRIQFHRIHYMQLKPDF
ncbi:hypothetical protein FGO68_gene9852 [Halteria grandinella]|uniref:Uncharacterized protein n=1 Tax=Halteria grandinella TaxID=5974 RepID=A0A8J8NTZ8_HALGN|nr:hypothetical protein FGO68_gene9852 [Halteria grandinella]